MQTTFGLVYYVITKEGKGKLPTAGDKLAVHYTGTLMADGKKFDSSVDRGQTFEFPVGMGRVIPGWDEGFLQLKEGSEAILLIPSDMAYGERGAGSDIPPSSILRFDVQFVKNNGSALQPPQ